MINFSDDNSSILENHINQTNKSLDIFLGSARLLEKEGAPSDPPHRYWRYLQCNNNPDQLTVVPVSHKALYVQEKR
jgi:hypothetical protein